MSQISNSTLVKTVITKYGYTDFLIVFLFLLDIFFSSNYLNLKWGRLLQQLTKKNKEKTINFNRLVILQSSEILNVLSKNTKLSTDLLDRSRLI